MSKTKDRVIDDMNTVGTWQEKFANVPDDDQVNHPSHYQSYNKELNIECIDAMRAAFGNEAVTNFCICNAFKYVWRHQSKELLLNYLNVCGLIT